MIPAQREAHIFVLYWGLTNPIGLRGWLFCLFFCANCSQGKVDFVKFFFVFLCDVF